ncbi:MAG: sugar transferase [Pseudomonadota bacterium]
MLAKDKKIPKRTLFLIIFDLIILFTAPIASIFIYVLVLYGWPEIISFESIDFTNFLINVFIFVIFLILFDQYDFRQDFRRKKKIFQIAAAIVIGGVANIFLNYLLGISQLGRGIYLFYIVYIFLAITIVRIAYSIVGSVGVYDKKTLIIGCGESGRDILDVIQKNPQVGLKVIGFLDNKLEKAGTAVNGVPVFHQRGPLRDQIMVHHPKLVIVAMKRLRFYDLIEDLTWCAQRGIEIWDTPTTYEYLKKRIPLKYVDELWLFHTAVNWPKIHISRMKRIMDLIVASLALVVSLPIILLTLVAVWLETGRPLILSQRRLGKNGKIINILKIRSMYQTAPKKGEKGSYAGDQRITKVGRVIRKLHVDELPQLLNVLKGDISMVGPRAELYDFVYGFIEKGLEDEKGRPSVSCPAARKTSEESRLSDGAVEKKVNRYVPFIEQRFSVDQGLTGWAQVMQPIASSTYDDMTEKLEYDLYYIRNISLLLDIIILIKTVRVVLLGKGK